MLECFDDIWSDDQYDLAVMDEFVPKSVRTSSWLNQFSDGQSMMLRTKGGQCLKKFNVPLIVLSNFSPQEHYAEVQLAAFLARFQVIRLDEPIRIEQYEFTVETVQTE